MASARFRITFASEVAEVELVLPPVINNFTTPSLKVRW